MRPTDIAVVQAEVEAAEAGVKQAQANFDLALVRSSQAGQILKIYTFAGERVGEKGIVALGNTSQMNVVAEVYETDIHKVEIGQQVTIKSQGLSSELSGKVTEIGLLEETVFSKMNLEFARGSVRGKSQFQTTKNTGF